MHQDVQLPIPLLQLRKNLVNLLVTGNVALENSRIRQLSSESLCFRTKPFILVANSNLRSGCGKLLCNRPGDAALISQAENNRRLTFEIYHLASIYQPPRSTSSTWLIALPKKRAPNLWNLTTESVAKKRQLQGAPLTRAD